METDGLTARTTALAGERRAARSARRAVPWRPVKGGPRSFDARRVGRMESALWVAYYRREWARFLVLSVRVVRSTFGMDWIRTVHAAWLLLRALQLWAPQGDPEPALPRLSRFYGLLRLTYGEPASPAHAAELDVNWWTVHRTARQGHASYAESLVSALAKVYAYAYSTDEESVWPAAQHRATAMDFSDRWVDEGCALDSPLLAASRAELVRAYAALLAAVHR
jgi:hypothetical protein